MTQFCQNFLIFTSLCHPPPYTGLAPGRLTPKVPFRGVLRGGGLSMGVKKTFPRPSAEFRIGGGVDIEGGGGIIGCPGKYFLKENSIGRPKKHV